MKQRYELPEIRLSRNCWVLKSMVDNPATLVRKLGSNDFSTLDHLKSSRDLFRSPILAKR